jgi:hypothetical protein
MAVSAETRTAEVVEEGTIAPFRWGGWMVAAAVALVLLVLGAVLLAGWQPMDRTAQITPALTYVREAPAVISGGSSGVTFSDVQVREAIPVQPSVQITPARTYVREAPAGTGGASSGITFSDVQVREAP